MKTYTIKAGSRELQVTAKRELAEGLGREIQSVVRIMQYRRELSGVIGEDEHSFTTYTMYGPGGGVMADKDGWERERDAFIAGLPEGIREDDIPGIVKQARAIFEKHVPIVDKRETAEAKAARVAEYRRLEEERAAKAEVGNLAMGASSPDDIVTWGPGEMVVYIEAGYDDSDSMSDYYNPFHSYGCEMALAVVHKQAETERLARSIVARYPELAKLTWEWDKSKSQGNSLQSCLNGMHAEGRNRYGGGANPALFWRIRCRLNYGGDHKYKMRKFRGYPGIAPSPAPVPAAPPATSESAPAPANDVPYTVEEEGDWTWLRFADKPAEEVRERIKAAFGARWSGRRSAWYIMRPVSETEIAAVIAA